MEDDVRGKLSAGGLRMSNPMIVSDPKILMGKPVIAGTRVTVELILEKAAAGESIDQIVASHPRLTRPAVLAAFAFAAHALRADAVYPLTPQPV
jgi:uncharacterized protein (DUF433 family)